MNKIIPIFSFLFILPVICRSQTDTIYTDDSNNKTTHDSAKYYSIVTFERENWYKVDRYYATTRTLEMTGHYSNVDSQTKEGMFIDYYKSGKIKSKGSFYKSMENGLWEEYYDTSGALWSTCNYVDGLLNGELTSFYRSGKLKRKEYHHYVIEEGKVNTELSTVKGKCYDEQGNKIKFTPFDDFPKPRYNLGSYLSQNLKYPKSAKENNIEGRVIVKFVVDINGNIIDVHVNAPVHPELDAEAVRVVSMMKPWKPGCQDDKPVKVYYNLPIIFKLH